MLSFFKQMVTRYSFSSTLRLPEIIVMTKVMMVRHDMLQGEMTVVAR